MKKKAGFYLLKGETFPYDIVVALGPTREQVLTHFEKRFKNALTEKDKAMIYMDGAGRTGMCENNAIILWTRDYPTTPQHFGFLAHEIFHATDLILRRAGVQLSNDSDEAFAYHIDWITRRIYGAFKLCKK